MFLVMFAHGKSVGTQCDCTSRYSDRMRPGLPLWWDAPAAFDEETLHESHEAMVRRRAVEMVTVEPVLVHVRPLFQRGFNLEQLAEQTQFTQWKWAIDWNAVRKAVAEDLFRVQNDDHETWLATIDPALPEEELDEAQKRRRGEAFRAFRADPNTMSYLMYMKDTAADVLYRCSVPGYARPW